MLKMAIHCQDLLAEGGFGGPMPELALGGKLPPVEGPSMMKS